MKRLAAGACAVLLLVSSAAFAIDGASSKVELQQLYSNYFQQKDQQKLGTLVYWTNADQRSRESFDSSMKNDLNYRLQGVEFVPLEPNAKFEYTLDGVTYVPGLPPVGRLVAKYEGQGNVGNFTTSYLVGTKAGRYFIVLATPKAK